MHQHTGARITQFAHSLTRVECFGYSIVLNRMQSCRNIFYASNIQQNENPRKKERKTVAIFPADSGLMQSSAKQKKKLEWKKNSATDRKLPCNLLRAQKTQNNIVLHRSWTAYWTMNVPRRVPLYWKSGSAMAFHALLLFGKLHSDYHGWQKKWNIFVELDK